MLSYRNKVLHIEQRPLPELVNEAETPFFLFSEARLRSNFAALKRGLSQGKGAAIIRYCVKTNNEAGILRIIADCGSEVMTAHPAEVELALKCGFAPEHVAYQRPVLIEHELESVLGSGVTRIHAYRESDLDLLEKVAGALGKTIQVSLRIRNGSRFPGLNPLAFLSRRLGFEEGGVELAAERILRSRYLKLHALNFYCGTQQKSSHSFQELMTAVVKICLQIKSRYGVAFQEVNFGGGIPSHSLNRMRLPRIWDRFEDRLKDLYSQKALEQFGKELAGQFIREARVRGLDPLPAVAAEPGRSIAGNAGIMLTRVQAIEGDWAFLDASRNYLGESVLLFRRRILPVVASEISRQRYYHFSGSTLNTTDVLDLRRRLPELSIGNVLCFADAGAYTISRASRYAGLCPAVYLLGLDGRMRLIRRPEEISDLVAPMTSLQDPEVLPRDKER